MSRYVQFTVLYTRRNIIKSLLNKYGEDSEFLIADGFDDAIIGVDESSHRVIYDVDKCIGILMKRDGMEYLEAMEYFDFNVRGSYVGEKTSIFCDVLEKD